MRPIDLPFRREIAALLLVIAAGLSCSDVGGTRDVTWNQRVELQAVDLGVRQGAEVVAEFIPNETGAPWVARSSGGTQLIELGPGEWGTYLGGIGKPKQLNVPLSADQGDFNEILVELTSRGPATADEQVRVTVQSDGRSIWSSENQKPPSSSRRAVLSFHMPRIASVEGAMDSVVIEFGGRHPESVVWSVRLIRRPLVSFLPRIEDGFGHYELGGELQRAAGLSSERQLRAELREVQEGARLKFAVGFPAELHLDEQRPLLVVRMEPEGAPATEHRIELVSEAGLTHVWRPADLRLPPVDRLVVSFGVESGGDLEAYALVTEPRVVVPREAPRTVLLITSDTHRADHLGATGGPSLVRTPNIDALAARGVLFENCVSQTNVTNPSHTALMTGLHPKDTRVLTNRTLLARGAWTLAEALTEEGYRTLGSLSVNHLLPHASGLGQGFDRVSAPLAGDRDAEQTIDVALDWLAEAGDEDVFLWLHLFDAHTPYSAPEPYRRRYYGPGRSPTAMDGEVVAPRHTWLEGATDPEYPRALYRAEVDYLDAQLRRILDLPRVRDGVVAFTADHGESLGQQDIWCTHAELYPDTIRIPLILSWPGGPRGTRTEAPVQQIDVGRTLLNLAGHEGVDFPGRDLRWALEQAELSEPRFIISSKGRSAAIEADGWYLLMQLFGHPHPGAGEPFEQGQVELFDLRTDPNCEDDLLLDELERAGRMRARLVVDKNSKLAVSRAVGVSRAEGMEAEWGGQPWLHPRETITNRETPLIGRMGLADGAEVTRSSRRPGWGAGE